MNTTNPFQIPSCLQRADLQLRRRERFRRGVVVIVAAVVALLVVLLIEGCMSEHAKTASATVPAITDQHPDAAPVAAPTATPQPVANPLPARPISSPSITPTLATKTVAPATVQPSQVYVVKSGDTLGRIAHQHHTTVKALKAANSLDSDIIAIGATLKLPSA